MKKEKLIDIVASKLIGPELPSVKYEDIPNKIGEILSKCLHKNVSVNGNGIDGKDIEINIK